MVGGSDDAVARVEPGAPVARVQARLERGIERYRAGRAPVHGRHDLDLVGRDAQRARDRVRDELDDPVRRLGRALRGHDDDLAGRVVDSRELAAAHTRRQPGDGPALGLAVERRQLGDGDDARVDQVAEHPARPDRRQLRGVADEQQMRAVSACLEQRVGQLDVEHRRLVDDDQALVERCLGIAGEAAAELELPAALAGLRAEEALGGAAGGRGERHHASGALGQRDDGCHRMALARAGPAGQHAHPGAQRMGHGCGLRLVEVGDRAALDVRLDRLGGGDQSSDGLGDRVLGLGVAGKAQVLAVERDHGGRLDGRVDRRSRITRTELGERVHHRSGRARRVAVTRIAGERVADQRPGPSRIVAPDPGQRRPSDPVGIRGQHAAHGQQQPRVVADEPWRRRTERVDDPAGDPGVQAGRHEQLDELVHGSRGQERREQPSGPGGADLGQQRQALGRDIGRSVDAGVAERGPELLAEPRPEPGVAERDERGLAQRTSSGYPMAGADTSSSARRISIGRSSTSDASFPASILSRSRALIPARPDNPTY